ncbi:hypothetical protein FOFC_16371 [Fusarium oxysporum]|nr:hypothetical protein FOFC_16371 [Fusarium oxysporum]
MRGPYSSSLTISDPKFAVADLEGFSAITRRAKIPLIVDANFSAAGFFCQPGRFGVDIIIHSATKCIGGHGTTLGGVIIVSSPLQGEVLEGSCFQAAYSTPMALLVIYSITSTI